MNSCPTDDAGAGGPGAMLNPAPQAAAAAPAVTPAVRAPKWRLALVVLGAMAGLAGYGAYGVLQVKLAVAGGQLDGLEERQRFHANQVHFKTQCERHRVVGRRIEDVLRGFAPTYGPPTSSDFAGTTYSWKGTPCELIVSHGIVEGVFYHDFPFTMQPTPGSYRITHARPYFERHPEFLGEDYAGDWGRDGGYSFTKRR